MVDKLQAQDDLRQQAAMANLEAPVQQDAQVVEQGTAQAACEVAGKKGEIPMTTPAPAPRASEDDDSAMFAELGLKALEQWQREDCGMDDTSNEGAPSATGMDARLRTAMTALHQTAQALTEAKAENFRLRAALEEIAKLDGMHIGPAIAPGLARKALAARRPEGKGRLAALELVALEARKVAEKFMRDIDAVNRMIDYKPGELPMKRDQGLEALNAALEALK